jgi:Ca-activated chloride channel family protein
MKTTICLCCMLILSINGISQNGDHSAPLIYIVDASGSMWGQIQGKSKMDIARAVLTTSINRLPEYQQLGFVVYGHRNKSDCTDVEFLIEVNQGSKSRVIGALETIKPLGMTPLAFSATKVIEQLRLSKQKATIILITDGIESCGGNICDVIAAAKLEGIDFKLHIIGFGLKAGDTDQLLCAVRAGGGQYYDAQDADALATVLDEATSQTIDMPASNMSVYALKNGKPIDATIKAYGITEKRLPVSARTYRDTAFMYLPTGSYNLEVWPMEGSDVAMLTVPGVQSFDDSLVHRNIYFDAGKIVLTTTNNGQNWDCLVKVADLSGKAVASLRTYDTPKEVEVNPGEYTLSIQAMKIEGINTNGVIENITVRSGGATPIGYTFESGTFSLETKFGGEMIDCVLTVSEVTTGKNVASGRTYTRGKSFLLNPGKYSVKVAPVGKNNNMKPQTVLFEVKKGEITSRTLNF